MLTTLRRALRRNPVTLAVVESDPARLAVRTVRSALAVERPGRFVAAGLVRRRGPTAHRLRGSGLIVNVRHGSRDLAVFREIFGVDPWPNVYEPPPEVDAILNATREPRIVDLGANIGLFGVYSIGRWPSATVESFEPDPANLPLLRETVAANRLEARWTVYPVAASNTAGELPFVSGLHAESQLAGVGDPAARGNDAAPLSRGEEIRVPVVDVFATLGAHVALLKIDIEGAEWAILEDPRLAALDADAIVLEWHAMGCPSADPAGEAWRLLAAAGFEPRDVDEQPGQTGMLWAWRPATAAHG